MLFNKTQVNGPYTLDPRKQTKEQQHERVKLF